MSIKDAVYEILREDPSVNVSETARRLGCCRQTVQKVKWEFMQEGGLAEKINAARRVFMSTGTEEDREWALAQARRVNNMRAEIRDMGDGWPTGPTGTNWCRFPKDVNGYYVT